PESGRAPKPAKHRVLRLRSSRAHSSPRPRITDQSHGSSFMTDVRSVNAQPIGDVRAGGGDHTADVLVERDGSVGVITLNRPARLNAVTPAMGDTLRSAFLDLEADSSVRAVVLTGAGRGFCAGADISGDVGNAREVLLDAWNPLVKTMRSLQLPIIAAINGV